MPGVSWGNSCAYAYSLLEIAFIIFARELRLLVLLEGMFHSLIPKTPHICAKHDDYTSIQFAVATAFAT